MEGPSLWPWWLWTLSALWVGALLFWQPVGAATRERWGWGALALVYAVLIVFGGRISPASPSDAPRDSWVLWLGLFVFLIGAVTSVGLRTPRWQQIASAVTPLGAGLVLAALQAPEAALGCGVLSILMARKSAVIAVVDHDGAIPRQNQWLVGVAAVATLVVVIGLVRNALIAESLSVGPSRWQTVFPTQAQVSRERSSHQHTGSDDSTLPIEAWGLAAIGFLTVFSRASSSRNDRAILERTP